jgi:ribosomal protein S18 acetylase RimI-like enzyme
MVEKLACENLVFEEIGKEGAYIDQVINLLSAAFPRSMTDFETLVPVLLRIESRKIFILREDENVVGSIIIENNHSKKDVYISYLAVRHECRNTGLGSMMLKKVEKFTKESGRSRISLEAEIDKIPFYQKMGFEIVERRCGGFLLDKKI